MLNVLTIFLATISYPGFGDRGLVKPPQIEASPRVDSARDMGPIVELTVRCPTGVTILAYSKVERLYCRPQSYCDKSFAVVAAKSCSGTR